MSVYLDMAHDAGERGEAAKQLAQAIEADHRATFEEESMTDKLSERMHASLDSDTLSFPIDEWADEVAALEQRVEDEIESRDGWKEAWKKAEQRVETLREALRSLAHGAHSGRAYANQILAETGEALAEEEA